MPFCEKFHQVDTKTILITLIQPKTTYCLSTFRLHVGSLHQESGLTSSAGRHLKSYYATIGFLGLKT